MKIWSQAFIFFSKLVLFFMYVPFSILLIFLNYGIALPHSLLLCEMWTSVHRSSLGTAYPSKRMDGWCSEVKPPVPFVLSRGLDRSAPLL